MTWSLLCKRRIDINSITHRTAPAISTPWTSHGVVRQIFPPVRQLFPLVCQIFPPGLIIFFLVVFFSTLRNGRVLRLARAPPWNALFWRIVQYRHMCICTYINMYIHVYIYKHIQIFHTYIYIYKSTNVTCSVLQNCVVYVLSLLYATLLCIAAHPKYDTLPAEHVAGRRLPPGRVLCLAGAPPRHALVGRRVHLLCHGAPLYTRNLNPKPCTRKINPNPYTRNINPKPYARNMNPNLCTRTINLKPETLNPKSQTLNPQPQALNPES